MSGIYDVNGNAIGAMSDDAVASAFLRCVNDGKVQIGQSIGTTLSVGSVYSDWAANAETAYNALLEEYKAIPSIGIPFFVSTDQHGSSLMMEFNHWLNNRDKDGMEMLNINLGDTTTDAYYNSFFEEVALQIAKVKNYIGVVGNHEYKIGEPINENLLNQCFRTTDLPMIHAPCTGVNYKVIDGRRFLKILVLSEYVLDPTKTSGSAWNGGFESDTAEWLIKELSSNDGLDVLILKRWPDCTTYRLRGEETETAEAENAAGSYHYNLWTMLKARKAKASGTFTDIDGNSHSYDFSQCETELLCTLHGHTHREQYSIADGLTAYSSDRLAVSIFGLIDRENSVMKIWKFDRTQVYDVLELPI